MFGVVLHPISRLRQLSFGEQAWDLLLLWCMESGV
jgi:hypothetical protein